MHDYSKEPRACANGMKVTRRIFISFSAAKVNGAVDVTAHGTCAEKNMAVKRRHPEKNGCFFAYYQLYLFTR